jgi:response regulator RpfG family c-di-GMP phosphodiesterase
VGAHGRRVSAYAVRLAAQYGLSAPAIETIRVGALLHDIGKIQVPPHILDKPGRLTEREWVRLPASEIGCDLVERMGFDEAVRIVLSTTSYDGWVSSGSRPYSGGPPGQRCRCVRCDHERTRLSCGRLH